MPHDEDMAVRSSGTRIRLFPQSHYLADFSEPETVWLSPPAGSVMPGPADDRMYVVDPVEKDPYEFPYLPPYRGPSHPPVLPDADGHLDYIDVNTRDFVVAHMYGGTRRTLDIWEGYFGRRIEWQFRSHFERLELVPVIDWDNAQSGYGFIEFGFGPSQEGELQIFSLNFDVIAHELGHSIVFSEVGHDPSAMTGEYVGFQEAAGDLIALISALHFDSVADRVLSTSRGNLYVDNYFNRLGELTEVAQVRVASNSRKLREFAAGWSDPHFLAQPLVGAIFDTFVDVYQDRLLQAGLIDDELVALTNSVEYESLDEGAVQRRYADAYEGRHEEFKLALTAARDYIGSCMAVALARLSPQFLHYTDVGDALLDADADLSGGRYRETLLANLRWRDIGLVAVGPQLAEHD